MEYTKGKWEVGSDSWDTYIGTANRYLAKIINSGSLSKEEVQANAHLIAACPAMYEALKIIVGEGTRCISGQPYRPVREIYNIDEVDRIARQALAKAEGKKEI